MSEIVEARDFAVKAHGDQKYGDRAYSVHLTEVAAIIEAFGFSDDHRKAAFLHDVLEDTSTTSDEIRERFGERVLRLVHACTGEGEARAERNAAIYRKIADYPDAAPIKLADRIANVEADTPGGRHWARYKAENDGFSAAIRPHVPAAMWARLERQFASMP